MDFLHPWMKLEDKLELISRNLQEIIGEEELKSILSKRDLRVYWGTATTGSPHIAYFLPILKIRDFLISGCSVKILFADMHAFLDNLKAPIDLVGVRTQYYEKITRMMLQSLDVDISKLEFIRGSTYQTGSSYVMDLYKLSTLVSEHDAKKAGSQVVKQVRNPKLGSLIYPCMQALDEEYLGVDAQFGGVDQRKIFTFAMKYLPMMGFGKRIHLMSPMIDGLNSSKMSSSDVFSKIDLIEDAEGIQSKIKKSYCAEGDTSSGLFQLLELVIFPYFCAKGLEIQVEDREHVCRSYSSFAELRKDFESKQIHPCDLKTSVAKMVEAIVRPIRDGMLQDIQLVENAYPLTDGRVYAHL